MSEIKAPVTASPILPGTPRSSASPRARRITVHLPMPSATSAAFSQVSARRPTATTRENASEVTHSSSSSSSSPTTTNVRSSLFSNPLLNLPIIATKPDLTEDSHSAGESLVHGAAALCRLPIAQPPQLTNKTMAIELSSPVPFDSPRPSFAPGGACDDYEPMSGKRSSSMNPLAASFTPSFVKAVPDTVTDSLSDSSYRPSRRSTIDSRDAVVAGLGISSPTLEPPSRRLTVNTKALSPSSHSRLDRPTFQTVDSPLLTSAPVDFNPEEFKANLMRQISDKLESGLDRHFSQIIAASATAAALPLSPATSDADPLVLDEIASTHLKKLLRTSTLELERLKDKNQELQDKCHTLELQNLDYTHQISRAQELEGSLVSRLKELGSCASSIDSIDSSSMNGYRNSSNGHPNPQVQRWLREIASLTAERDALKIKSWELEKKPFAQQHQQRPPHYVDLENERNRLVEELGAKTVAMEDLWNKNESLSVRAKEYEKRVWELEGQCAALEEDCSALPKIRAQLVELEARADPSEDLTVRTAELETQKELTKSLQDRIQELETTNAELDHSNWDLSERLNIVNNQHGLLTKEFESLRSKDKDDRRLEMLTARYRELETQLADQAKTNPDYKDEYDRVSTELEKLKIRLPQLEGQSKQVTLLRSRVLQLEKQIKAAEELEPRLGEFQALHERNLFLEGELGDLELLRARELELESELEDARARLTQLETNRSRVGSLSGIRLGARARSSSIAQHNPAMFQEGDELLPNELAHRTESPVRLTRLHRPSQSIGSLDAMPGSPKREVSTASAWPSGRSSATPNRMSSSSSTSSSYNQSNNNNAPLSPSRGNGTQDRASTPTSPREMPQVEAESREPVSIPMIDPIELPLTSTSLSSTSESVLGSAAPIPSGTNAATPESETKEAA